MIVEHRASLILFNVLSGVIDKTKTYILPANVCPIVPLTYLKAGVKFEFVDINFKTLCVDEDLVVSKLLTTSQDYGGVHYVHTYGIENDSNNFFKKIKSINPSIFIINDKCLNVPNFQVENLPDFIDLEFYSTGYSKFVDIGWGGFGYLQPMYCYPRNRLPYKASDLEKLTLELKKCLEEKLQFQYKESSNWLGDSSYRFSSNHYVNLVKDKIKEVQAHKAALNAIYYQELPPEIQLPDIFQNWRFNILVPGRNELLKKILNAGLFASAHYASVTNLFGQPNAPCAEKKNEFILNLFNDFRFDVNKSKRVVSIIKTHLDERIYKC